jgi:predicted short-subunit dehydrogenase-like oxidoreductase (DUF2520 family)
VVAAADGGGGSAARLAAQVAGCRVAPDAAAAVGRAGTVLVTVPDDALAGVVAAVAAADAWQPGQQVVHCSGARGTDVLRLAALAGARVAACHPAQTVPAGAGADDLLGVPWAVTCDDVDRDWAEALVVATGGDPFALAAGARTLYHAGLTVGSNAAAAAVAVARQLLLAAGVEDPGRVLVPLAEASVRNTAHEGATALTGPVVRGDTGTVTDHLAALDDDLPRLAQAYRALQGVVLDQVTAALDPATAGRLTDLLADGREEPPWNG